MDRSNPVKNYLRLSLLCLAAALPSFAAPTITQILNNYGLLPDGAPNYGIAQGSIAIIKGAELSDRSTGLQTTYPLPTTLEGVTVDITVNGVTKRAILYYVLPVQLAFIVPSDTPVGTGTVKVTNNGKVVTAPITITKSGFGVLTLNGAGSGPVGATFNGTANFVLNTNAANPNDFIVFWGSGVGGTTLDERNLANSGQDMKSTQNVQLWLGSQLAEVLYAGTSQFPGLNQIVIKVPNVTGSAASTFYGCYVSVVVVSNGVPSNFGSIPIAQSGRTCTDSSTALSPDQVQTLNTKGTLAVGVVQVGKTSTTTPGISIPGVPSGIDIPGLSGGTTVTDDASGFFIRYTPQSYAGNLVQTTSYGSCVVITSVPTSGVIPTSPTYLDAGAALNLAGPAGTAQLPKQTQFGLFYGLTDSLPTGFIPTAGGNFTFTGPGGKDVGAFTTTLTVPPTFTWTNQSSIASSGVTRASGVTVNWTGGPSGGFMQITGSSSDGKVFGSFTCTAPVSAGTFAVPPPVTLSLPASVSTAGISTASLSLSVNTNPVAFSPTPSGLDYAYKTAYFDINQTLSYK
jgi:uncharacterized protein (TIGR03437 family)